MQTNISPLSRRQFLRAALSSQPKQPQAPPPYTPNGQFFQQRISAAPTINPEYWSFVLHGKVDLPVFLSFDDLLRMPAVETEATLACIGRTPGGKHIGHARWDGVPLSTILDEAGIQQNAGFARIYAADGYMTSLPLERLSGALLAHSMNGETLPPEHGFPARLIVPGLYGYKMPKWIQRIELAAEPLPGPWEQRGWSSSGEVQITSAILSPQHREIVSGPVAFRGFALSGNAALTNIELSIDDGPWMPIAFNPTAAGSWVRWSIDWTPPGSGDFSVKVRASDSSGFTQDERSPMFPHGTTAMHHIVVRVL